MSIRVWTWDAASSWTLEHGTTLAMTPATHELLFPAVRTFRPTPWSAITISASDQVTVYASQLADGHPLACPPPGVSQRYQDVIHTIFIVGTDDKNTLRGAWACMWSRLVINGCTDSWVVSPLTISISRLQSYAVG